MEAKTKTINGHSYTVTPFPGRHAIRLEHRLKRSLLPGLAALMGAAKLKDKKASLLDAEIDGAACAKAVEQLCGDLGNPEEFLALVEELVSMTRRDGKELTGAVIDLEFQGNLAELYKVMAFVVEVNFGDFFGAAGIGGLGDLVKAKIADSLSGSQKP